MRRSKDGSILIVLLVLFIVAFGVAVFIGYTQYQDKVKLQADLEAEKTKVEPYKQVTEDLRRQLVATTEVVGYNRGNINENSYSDVELIRTELEYRKKLVFGFFRIANLEDDPQRLSRNSKRQPAKDLATGELIKVDGEEQLYWVVDPAKESLETLHRAPEDANLTLMRLIRHQDRLLDDLVDSNYKLWTQLNIVVDAYGALQKKSEKEVADKNIEITRLGNSKTDAVNQIQDEKKKIEEQFSRVEPDILSAIQQLSQQRLTELEDQNEKLQVEVRLKESEVKKLMNDLVKLRLRDSAYYQRKDEPDGRVTYSDRENDLVYVDRGWQDGIQKGLRFTVFKPLKGGRRLVKGTIEVKQILGNHFSQCVLIDRETGVEEDVFEGDLIISPIYDPDRRFLTFAFAGLFGGTATRYSKEHAKALLEQAGARVMDEVDPSVDVIIVGKDYQRDDNYMRGQELNIPVMTEDQLHAYLGYRR